MTTRQSPNAPRHDAMIAFDAVACVRGGNVLFEDLSFAVCEGGALLVSGPNGAGKSSLLRLAAGLLDPVAGRISRSATTALTDERAALDPEQSVARALGWWARLDGAPDGAVDAALATLGCTHLAPVPVRLLSTGQRKRAALARTIASGAALWLLDEPANGLDADAIPLLEAAIARHRAAGGAVMVATHIALALPDAQRVALGAAVPA
ncbi:heme ABC exporter ATP-binding protein CcmA [Sphingorhabdus soli]|uniref:Heme ABC exporter ATP-binding protein CcmA n=1 Tax=Flavisphingopyxis soli TaxID=2601267 RepID=A0A5C6UMZ3_9SPHN|nr:heme ABC exporter ATP-binding protein CcmA [Sphingorhabdus soli]TXC73904.1 heme ABC exporter ATP-binding protein CcmA [Sphingorhabdus soli]